MRNANTKQHDLVPDDLGHFGRDCGGTWVSWC